MKIITILGARPQFIKASLISKLFNNYDNLDEVLIHTGQHYDKNMSEVFFNELKLPKPKYNLNINQMSHGEMTGLMLIQIEKILLKEKPHGVLVYGDTNSTLAGSLAAAKLKIPVFHVEAGLRSYNHSMPEEINRLLTDHASSLLFCPTINSTNLLAKEGISKGVIHSGDVMYDLFLSSIKKIDKMNDSFVLATIHRPINTDHPITLGSIISGLEKINSNIKVVLTVHPKTQKKIKEFNFKPNFTIIPPLSYLEMLKYLISAELVVTDSGGIQKEAFFSKTKCITVRNETEWVELIDSGVNILCNSTKESIWSAFNKMYKKDCDFSGQLFGNGKASVKIVNTISKYFE